MLVDYEYRNGNLIISHVDNTKQIKLRYYKWPNATKYITTEDDDPQRDGQYVTWDGRSVKKVPTRNPNRYAVYDFIEELPQEEQDIIFNYNEPDIFFVDIENEIIDKKPAPHLAESAILSISIVNKDKVLVMGTAELSETLSKSIEEDINNYFLKFGTLYQFKYIHFKSEYDMLLNFFVKFVPRMPVLTGWNFTEYDWVFLVNRSRKLGIDPSVASVTKILREPWDMEKKTYAELPAHRMVVDYMELFKKWDTSIRVKESIGLDFVSDSVLGVKKVNYEGTLKTLHLSDYKKFVFYNAVDSVLVQKIHEKTKLIDILYGISTLSRVKIGDSYSTLPVTEGILRKKLKKEKNVVLCRLDRSELAEVEGVLGGFVKDPVKGMSHWTSCYDFASLYPTSMRMFNISVDSYKGVISSDKKNAMFNNKKIAIEPNDIILLNGAVFRNEIGVVNQVMTTIYGDRKRYKGLMLKDFSDLDELKNEETHLINELIGELQLQ